MSGRSANGSSVSEPCSARMRIAASRVSGSRPRRSRHGPTLSASRNTAASAAAAGSGWASTPCACARSATIAPAPTLVPITSRRRVAGSPRVGKSGAVAVSRSAAASATYAARCSPSPRSRAPIPPHRATAAQRARRRPRPTEGLSARRPRPATVPIAPSEMAIACHVPMTATETATIASATRRARPPVSAVGARRSGPLSRSWLVMRRAPRGRATRREVSSRRRDGAACAARRWDACAGGRRACPAPRTRRRATATRARARTSHENVGRDCSTIPCCRATTVTRNAASRTARTIAARIQPSLARPRDVGDRCERRRVHEHHASAAIRRLHRRSHATAARARGAVPGGGAAGRASRTTRARHDAGQHASGVCEPPHSIIPCVVWCANQRRAPSKRSAHRRHEWPPPVRSSFTGTPPPRSASSDLDGGLHDAIVVPGVQVEAAPVERDTRSADRCGLERPRTGGSATRCGRRWPGSGDSRRSSPRRPRTRAARADRR